MSNKKKGRPANTKKSDTEKSNVKVNKNKIIMKLKDATQLAIIGVIMQLILAIVWFMIELKLISYINSETGQVKMHMQYLFSILNVVGTGLLLPFFIILFKNQK